MTARALSTPLGRAVRMRGGLMAGAAFTPLRKLVARVETTPRATERNRTWPEVLAAAALLGTVVGFVKAALDGAGVTAFGRTTGAGSAT